MSEPADSARLLDVLLPTGGELVTVSEAYFDESYDDRSPRMLCVAGYVFRKSKSKEFGKEWSGYLRRKGLPYFHANECAHSCGVFEGRNDADAVSRKLISLTAQLSGFGVAIAVDQDAYANLLGGRDGLMPTVYAFALTNCLYNIMHWRSDRGATEPTAFFFEQGHKHANDAHQFLTFMLKSDKFGPRLGYRSHAFVPKETPQVQPADLFAWLWRLQARRLAEKSTRPHRADLRALVRPQDKIILFRRPELEKFARVIERGSAEATEVMRMIAREIGFSEEAAQELAVWKPDYRTSRW